MRAEALRIVERYLETYRRLDYSELVLKIGEQETFDGKSEAGEKYQVEIDFFYDDEQTKNLRVAGSVSFGLITDFAPVADDFIIAPDGSFIGE
jgi:hypothetical protein